MKWMFIGLFVAALMVGAGFLLTDTGPNSNLSSSAEAIRLSELGSQQVQSFKFTEGAQNLETALELDPSLAEAAISLATAYGRVGKIKQYKKTLALADSLTNQIQDDNRRMVAQIRLGTRHQRSSQGLIDSLLTRLEKELPDNIHVMLARIGQLEKAGKVDEVYQGWQNILVKNPNYAEAYNMLGYFEMNRGNFEPAIEHMKKYAFLAPDLANPHDSLGEVLMVHGQYEEAAMEFRAAIALQPDFYFSYLNLGKTLLYQGKIKSGIEIMTQVQEMVTGTDLGRNIDQDLVFTCLEMGMDEEVAQRTLTYVNEYPDHELSPYFRSIRLAHMGKMSESQALMDSTMTAWRSHEMYHASTKSRQNVDMAGKRYEAYMADLADQPSTRIRKWNSVLNGMGKFVPLQNQRSARIKLANAYMDNGEPLKAQEQIRPILEANNRLVPALVVAVRSDLALGKAQQARLALEQLKWSIQQSDEDFYARKTAALLEERVIDLEGHP